MFNINYIISKTFRNKLYSVWTNCYSRPGKESSEQYSKLTEGWWPFTSVRLEKLIIHREFGRRLMPKCLGIIILYRIQLWVCLLNQKSKTERIKLLPSNITIAQKKKKKLKKIYKLCKNPNTQQCKIHNVWNPNKDYQAR